MARICPERPELLDGVPVGMYHCPACGCMVVAAMAHLAHDPDACYLNEFDDDDFDGMMVKYKRWYTPLLDRDRRPTDVGLPPGCVWVWMGGAAEPHWAVRGTGLVDS